MCAVWERGRRAAPAKDLVACTQEQPMRNAYGQTPKHKIAGVRDAVDARVSARVMVGWGRAKVDGGVTSAPLNRVLRNFATSNIA